MKKKNEKSLQISTKSLSGPSDPNVRKTHSSILQVPRSFSLQQNKNAEFSVWGQSETMGFCRAKRNEVDGIVESTPLLCLRVFRTRFANFSVKPQSFFSFSIFYFFPNFFFIFLLVFFYFFISLRLGNGETSLLYANNEAASGSVSTVKPFLHARIQ